jgi:hypothetical protein
MVYFLPNEFMVPANQVVQEETSLGDEQLEGLMAQLVLAKQAIFDKPTKNRHMRLLYLKGYVNGKPSTHEPTAYCLDGTGFMSTDVSHLPCISSSSNG